MLFNSVEDLAPQAPTGATPAPAGGSLFKSVDDFAPTATPAAKPETNMFPSTDHLAPPKPSLDSLVKNTKPIDMSALFPKTKSNMLTAAPGLKVDLKNTVAGQENYLTKLGNDLATKQSKVNQKDPQAVKDYNDSVEEYNQVYHSYSQNKMDLGSEENDARVTKNPLVAKITGGTTLKAFASDVLGGLPDASKKVSDYINRPLTKASNFLSNTNFIKEAAEGVNEGYGKTAVQTLQKLSDLSGTQIAQGATSSLYQAPETGQKDDFVDTVLKGLSQGVGAIIGFKSIGAFLPTAGVTGAVTNLVNKYPLAAKYFTPYIGEAIDIAAGMGVQTQLNPNLAGDLTARAKTLLTTIGEAPLYAALGAIGSAKVSVPASFGLGFGMAKLSGAANKDAIASGFTFALMDGVAHADGTRGLSSTEIHEKLQTEALKILNAHAEIKISEKSSPEQIKAAYNAAVHQSHPDLGGSEEALQSVKNAYDLLSKGSVSAAKSNITEEEKSAETVHQEIRQTINTHGPDVAHAALQDSLGVDKPTADRLIHAAETKSINDHPAETTEGKAIEIASVKQQAQDAQMKLDRTTKEDSLAGKRENLRLDKESILQQTKDYKANKLSQDATPETKVKAYRIGTDEIQPGDHISLSKEGAEKYLKDRKGAKLFQSEVTLKDLVRGQGTKNEFVYVPKEVPVTKTSKVAKSLEAKAIEAKLATQFKDLAGYEPRQVKDQIERVTDLIENRPEDIAPILSGEKPLPEGMSGSMFIKGVEEHALANKDSELLQKLASSELTGETSIHASELRLLAERNPESAVKAIKELAQAKKEAAEKRAKTGKIKNADGNDVKTVKKSAKESIKKATPSKQTWGEFIDSIQC